ncbi:MAG TPA: methyltransferase domain-containing protein [Solirubrobacterales bacterium]|nr:methyltransferase domain-containing protein [Solirubrobacterales bacterium]
MVEGVVESLPLADKSVDAAMGVLTIHHWQDPEAGLAEMRRVARRRIVLLTLDAEAASDTWLIKDYFPEAGSMDRDVMPSRATLRACLPDAVLEAVPVPHGCLDGFTSALWDRPELLLNPEVRRASSTWHRIPPEAAERGLKRLSAELESGLWDENAGAGATRACAASRGDQVQQLTLALVIGLNRLRGEHQRQGIENILSGLCTGAPLAQNPWHSGDRGDNPPVLSWVVEDRQIELGHADNDTCGL